MYDMVHELKKMQLTLSTSNMMYQVSPLLGHFFLFRDIEKERKEILGLFSSSETFEDENICTFQFLF